MTYSPTFLRFVTILASQPNGGSILRTLARRERDAKSPEQAEARTVRVILKWRASR